jgi:2'-5' RNA ligase
VTDPRTARTAAYCRHVRSSLVLLVPEADPLVEGFAHVTLLFPFVPAEELTPEIVDRVRAQLAGTAPLDLRFERTGRFPGVAYLALADPAPVNALIATLAAAWPAYPPYGGVYREVIPHLTLAHVEDADADADAPLAAAEAAAAPHLPLHAHVDAVTVLVEDAEGHWHAHARVPLTTPSS